MRRIDEGRSTMFRTVILVCGAWGELSENVFGALTEHWTRLIPSASSCEGARLERDAIRKLSIHSRVANIFANQLEHVLINRDW